MGGIDTGADKLMRWTPQRKAVLLLAIDYQLLSVAESLERFALTEEELASWRRALGRHGVPGLRATRLQIYRDGGID